MLFSSYNDDLAFKLVFVAVYFAERCEVPSVYRLLFMYMKVFLMLVPWSLLHFIGFYGLDIDGWYSLGINDYFNVLFGFVNSSELVKYSRGERYLATKIGTISLVLWWVVFITYG